MHAHINTQGGHFGNALQAASQGGHEQVVKMLFDAGADANASGVYGNSNALRDASYRGHKQVVKLLLDKGADVNALGKYGNALEAAWEGHEEVV